MYYSDVKDEYGYANIKNFPKDADGLEFDVKEIHDDLNVCDKCGDICNWYEEMYWQAMDSDDVYHECMGDTYTAVCDDCYSTLKEKKND